MALLAAHGRNSPFQNGPEFADELRSKLFELGAQVLREFDLMTGYSGNDIVHQGRLDPGDLIQKPLPSAQLATTIRNILDA
jgi:hypothetical protein